MKTIFMKIFTTIYNFRQNNYKPGQRKDRNLLFRVKSIAKKMRLVALPLLHNDI
jgi:hypothetical protein